MLAYTIVGTNDLQKAAEFYDQILAEFGAARFLDNERIVSWRATPGQPLFAVAKPEDRQPATAGNGVLIALSTSSRATLDAVHAKALKLGGKNEGAPGVRFEQLYAARFRDLDGNKIELCCFG